MYLLFLVAEQLVVSSVYLEIIIFPLSVHCIAADSQNNRTAIKKFVNLADCLQYMWLAWRTQYLLPHSRHWECDNSDLSTG